MKNSAIKVLLTIILILFSVFVFCSCVNSKTEQIDDNPSVKPDMSLWKANCAVSEEPYDISEVKIQCDIRCTLDGYSDIIINDVRFGIDTYDSSFNWVNRKHLNTIIKSRNLIADEWSSYTTEEIIIPPETFALNYGELNIGYSGEATGNYTYEKETFTENGRVCEEVTKELDIPAFANVHIYYKIKDKKVYLSKEKFTDNPKQQFSQYANSPISVGYERQKNKDEAVDFLSINSENCLFDIKNTSVNLSFGRLFNKAEELQTVYLAIYKPGTSYSFNSETGEVWPSKDFVGDLYEITGYGKEKYDCRKITNHDGTVDMEYNYTEKFVLPSKLFDESNDHYLVEIKLFAENPKENKNATLLAETFLRYYTNAGKVYIF